MTRRFDTRLIRDSHRHSFNVLTASYSQGADMAAFIAANMETRSDDLDLRMDIYNKSRSNPKLC